MRSNPEVQGLIERLVRSFAETLATLSRLEEGELDEVSGHPCAMGGSVRKLLVHNIAHDRMHAGLDVEAGLGHLFAEVASVFLHALTQFAGGTEHVEHLDSRRDHVRR